MSKVKSGALSHVGPWEPANLDLHLQKEAAASVGSFRFHMSGRISLAQRCPYTTSGWFVLHVTSETIKPSPALSFYAQSRVRQLQHEAMKRVQLDGFDSRRFRDKTNVTTRQPSQEQHLLESSCNAQAPILRQGFMCPEKISLKCLFHFMAMVWSWHGGRMALGTYPIAEFDSSWVTFSCQELKCGKNDRGNLEILLVFWVATSLKDSERHLTFLVSTYLFVRCNNHKSVWHLCEEVSWLSPEMKLIYLCLRRCLNYSWLILVQVPLYLEICIPFFFSQPMAASSSNKMETPDPDWNLLQPNLPINQVDWDMVKNYLFDRFTTPPTEFIHRQGQTIIPDVHPTRICEHIMHFRPCPSFLDPAYRCQGYHPEFLLQGPDVIWTPRTWSCRAFQRRTDLAHQDHCHRPECQQLHRPGWAHSELVAFRSWALSVNRAYWFTIYCCQPNINGKTPLYVTHYQDIHHCLTNQAYLPYADFIKHSWKETVDPPLTYILDTPSHVPPFAANYTTMTNESNSDVY